MRVVSRKKLREFWEAQPDAEQPLRAWYAEVERANWTSPADVKIRYPSASILSKERIVFNIKGNKYRIVVVIKYVFGMIYIRFVGTHAAYDKIDSDRI